MKKYLLSLLVIVLFSIFATSQNCPFNNSLYRNLTPTSQGETVSDPCVFGGDYVTVDVIQGNMYEFSTCLTAYIDITLTLYDTEGQVILATNDDACDIFAGPSAITWMATYTGTVNLIVNEFPCNGGFDCINLDVTWQESLGTNDDFVVSQVSIYPNPTSEVVNIDLGDVKDKVTLKIFNIKGSLIHTKQVLKSRLVQFNLNATKGLYFIEISSEGRKNTYKLIKK